MNSKKNPLKLGVLLVIRRGVTSLPMTRERTMGCGFWEIGMHGSYWLWTRVQERNSYAGKPYRSHHPGESTYSLWEEQRRSWSSLSGFQRKKLTRHAVDLMRKYMKPESMVWFKDLSTSAKRNLGDAITQLASHPQRPACPDNTLLSQHLPQAPLHFSDRTGRSSMHNSMLLYTEPG